VVWVLESYNLPFARFPKNKGISGRNLALPSGINHMGSAHMSIGFKSEPYYACFVLYSQRFVWFVSNAKVLEQVNVIQLEILQIALTELISARCSEAQGSGR